MSFINLLKIALRALRRNKLRAFLTMLGIIIGVGAVITMMSIGEGSKKSIESTFSSMGTNMITIRPYSNIPMPGGVRMGSSNIQTLTLNDVEKIGEEVKNISALSPGLASGGQAIRGSKNWPTSIQGVGPDYLSIRKLEIASGSNFNEEHIKSFAKVCVIGQTVVKNLFEAGENPVGQIIRFGKIPFQVIGVLAAKGQNTFGQDQDDIIVAPYTTIMKRISATIYLQNIYVSAVSEDLSNLVTDDIIRTMRASHKLRTGQANDFDVRTQAELISNMSSTSNMMTTLLTAVAAISLVIGGIGIMNIMYVSVTERTREIGLRMSIGAKGRDILLQFLTEAIIISITGGLIGVLLGVTASWFVSRFLNWPTIISESSMVISFFVCVFTGVFFGYYPAIKAASLDPIDALRYE
ncbi:ABC transporter permease [Flavihumibacter stibioxidans]|uniref:Multidrug ABC transporter substrate-binding protein n=1 Tax=Flavihumibacter stibioxidans TaxID=1834163 RepID=A0ABR7M6T6_9BACT|nr:ABC transporter permease [Flavihumibacter stibioxidans]MBC6490544.1 multidrug ABC transporter substrate-binding protein [Flavihumibacter stibioxidans]